MTENSGTVARLNLTLSTTRNRRRRPKLKTAFANMTQASEQLKLQLTVAQTNSNCARRSFSAFIAKH